MRKVINIFSTFILLIFSFYYTNKVLLYLKDKDPIMIQIKTKKQILKEPINANIKDNTIIPGLSGLKIDQNKSYQKMKKFNKYQKNLLVLKKIPPKISLKDNQDKLIINGNTLKKEISIIVKIDNLDILNKIKKKEYFNKLNLILSKELLLKNIKLDNNLLIIEDNIDLNLKINYCYSTTINFKNICKMYNKYTVYPTFINYNYHFNTYQILKNGSILAYNIINESNIDELNILINKLNLEYKIILLDKLLEE